MLLEKGTGEYSHNYLKSYNKKGEYDPLNFELEEFELEIRLEDIDKYRTCSATLNRETLELYQPYEIRKADCVFMGM
jgi:hypothetical protein